jgi:hypothetical protein
MKYLALVLSVVFCSGASASEINRERAHYNYQMFCQGCHAPGGASVDASVPRLKDYVGTFLRSPEGRGFLARVPGSATSSLDNEELAEVLNWIVLEFSGDSLNTSFEHYTAIEVGSLRRAMLNEVVKYRAKVLADIAAVKSRE